MKRTMNSNKPHVAPTLAMSSARRLSLDWRGVDSGSVERRPGEKFGRENGYNG